MTEALAVEFGGEVRSFFLPMKQILVIERECGDKSISTMYEQMNEGVGLDRLTDAPRYVGAGAIRIKDVYEIIRCAAIGGGLSPNDASRLVSDYVDGRPYTETVPVAWAILDRTLMGVRLKKKEQQESSASPSHSVEEASSRPVA